MIKDAETHAEEDKQRREAAEVRNNAETLVYQTEKVLVEQSENIEEADRVDIDAALDTLKVALEGEDLEVLRAATETLTTVSQAFGQKLYEAAAAQAGAENTGAPVDGDDDVVDAEIVEEDE